MIFLIIEIYEVNALWGHLKSGSTLCGRDKNILPTELPENFSLLVEAYYFHLAVGNIIILLGAFCKAITHIHLRMPKEL